MIKSIKRKVSLEDILNKLILCNAGIIKAFKAHYGSLLVDFLIEQIENGPIESGLIMPNIKQCMQLVNIP